MYGKLNERKINQGDYVMSCSKARQQLANYMNQEAKRTNIDSAKKRAVLQHMDYEGFRQMVLGANIFPTKSKQLYNFTKGQSSQVKSQQQPQNTKQKHETIKQSNQQIEMFEKVQSKSEVHCNNFRQFKKKFNETYTKQFEAQKTEKCYNLIKQQNQERISKIFNADCDGQILVKLCLIFKQILKEMINIKSELIQQQSQFILIFCTKLFDIVTIKQMIVPILSKKEKGQIIQFLNFLKQIPCQRNLQNQINKIKEEICK